MKHKSYMGLIAEWLSKRMTNCMSGHPNYWKSQWLADQLANWLNDWPTVRTSTHLVTHLAQSVSIRVFLSAEYTKIKSRPALSAKNMATTQMNEKLAESVRNYPCLYDKRSAHFRTKTRKRLLGVMYQRKLDYRMVSDTRSNDNRDVSSIVLTAY